MNHGHHDKLLIAYVDLEFKIVAWNALVAVFHAPKDGSAEHVVGGSCPGPRSTVECLAPVLVRTGVPAEIDARRPKSTRPKMESFNLKLIETRKKLV